MTSPTTAVTTPVSQHVVSPSHPRVNTFDRVFHLPGPAFAPNATFSRSIRGGGGGSASSGQFLPHLDHQNPQLRPQLTVVRPSGDTSTTSGVISSSSSSGNGSNSNNSTVTLVNGRPRLSALARKNLMSTTATTDLGSTSYAQPFSSSSGILSTTSTTTTKTTLGNANHPLPHDTTFLDETMASRNPIVRDRFHPTTNAKTHGTKGGQSLSATVGSSSRPSFSDTRFGHMMNLSLDQTIKYTDTPSLKYHPPSDLQQEVDDRINLSVGSLPRRRTSNGGGGGTTTTVLLPKKGPPPRQQPHNVSDTDRILSEIQSLTKPPHPSSNSTTTVTIHSSLRKPVGAFLSSSSSSESPSAKTSSPNGPSVPSSAAHPPSMPPHPGRLPMDVRTAQHTQSAPPLLQGETRGGAKGSRRVSKTVHWNL